MACRKTMRIKDVRQGLHTLVHTQGLDGLLHLYQRLGRPDPVTNGTLDRTASSAVSRIRII